ncbi:hypothetical protein [Vibrio cholerae]|uniref:hypothetical protein n=1 Tax=Vibrio cholerae TaxID=666 RepID=UPI000B048DEF|nr:hypothetical protein [Vibrio cholerae]HAS3169426.1 hypothetical protein [Vibrio cholerae]
MCDRLRVYLLGLSLTFCSLSLFSVRATALTYILMLFILGSSRDYFNLKSNEVIFFILIILFPLLFSNPNVIHFNYYIKYCLLCLYLASLFFLIRNYGYELFYPAVKISLMIHVAVFYFQLLYYFIFGEFVNFDQFIREDAAEVLYQTKALDEYLINIRATGLFSEPSFYSMVVTPLALFLLMSSKKDIVLIFISFLSTYLSLSVAAILISSFVLIIFMLSRQSNIYLRVFVIVSLLLSFGFFYEFIELRVLNESDYDAIGSRLLIVNEFFVRGWWLNTVGAGFFENENYPMGVTGLAGAHTRDSSFFIYLFYSSGWIGSCIFFSIIFAFLKNRNIIFYAPILFYKFHFVFGTIWIIFAILYAEKYKENDSAHN